MLHKITHHLVTSLDLFLVLQRKTQPAAHQSAAHRRHRLVNNINQSLCVYIGRVQQLQITNGEFVQPNILSLINTRQRSDMVELIMLRFNQIMNRCACCHYALREIIDTETFQGDRVEMLVKNLVGIVVSENPIVENGQVIFRAEQVNEVLTFVALHQHLGRIEALQQLVNVFVVALRQEKLTSRDIQKRHTRDLLFEMHGSQEIVLLLFKNVVIVCDSWRNQLHYPTLHQFLGQFGVFKLLTHRYFQTSTDQFRQIGVEGMMRETRQLHVG